jgi:hypothetical protein
MAAEALGKLGDKAARRKDVAAALREAAADADPALKDAARASLAALGLK